METLPMGRAACALALACLASAWPAAAGLAEVPAVVASIKPVHALVAGVMAGLGEPVLLVEGARSPHTYSMRPSDARALQDAALVVWIGPGLETFLERPLATLDPARLVTLSELPGLTQLPARPAGLLAVAAAPDQPALPADDHDHGPFDQHLWLDPVNARVMVAAIAERLATADLEHAAAYRANGARMNARIEALEQQIAAELRPVRDRPYVVFHDAYHYFEARFGLRPLAALTVSPEQAPGARRLRSIRDALNQLGAACVFAEPGFEPAVLQTLVEGTSARTGVLDPEGLALAPGPELYPQLLQGLADSLTGCLGR
jgi:zinc transport system substrate-binding protein